MSDSYDGNKFVTTQDGLMIATPLLLVLVVIELSDVLFAVDSIPAVRPAMQKGPFPGVHFSLSAACPSMGGGIRVSCLPKHRGLE